MSSAIRAISIFVFTLLTGSSGIAQQDAQILYTDAVEAYSKQDYQQAVKHASDAIRIRPDNQWAFHVRSLSYLSLRDFDRALADASEAIRLDDKNARLVTARAWVHYHKHDWPKMLDDANEAVRLDSNDPFYLEARAIAFAGLKKFDKALDDIKSALRRDAHYGRAYALRAYIHAYQMMYKEAVADYDLAIKYDANDVGTLIRYARLLATCPKDQIRDGNKAVELAKRACEITKEKQPGPLSALAAGYAECGRFDEAIQFEQRAQEICRDETALEVIRINLQTFKEHRPVRANTWYDP